MKHADGHLLSVQCFAQVETIHSQRSNVIPKIRQSPACFLMGRLILTQALSGKLLLDIQLDGEILCSSDCAEDEDFLSWTLRLDLISQMRGRIHFIRECLGCRNMNALAMRFFHKSKEVATDGDLVDIAFEALVAIETCPCGCGTKYDCHDIHLQLVKQVAGDNEAEQQKLRVALYQKDATTVKKILTTGLDPNFVYDSGDDMGKTPAMIAASYGSQDILHSLLCAGAEWLEEHFETGRTVLHFAAEANNIEAVQFVLENCNVDIDFVTHFDLEERSAGMLTTCREIRDMILTCIRELFLVTVAESDSD